MSSGPLIEIRDATKRFASGPTVLDRLNLEIRAGEFVALIGPSGCGKSTLLRLVAGLEPLSSGSISVAEQSTGAAGDEIGFVFQEPTLLPWLTAAQNVELPMKLRGMAAVTRAAKTREALELARLADKARAYPRQLSGGQKMRVSIARALALSPKILLLDEPFGALDEMTREHLNEELLAIREQQQWTALFVTHSVAEAVFLSHRVVILAANPGRIHTDVRIDLPRLRIAETRMSPDYLRLVGEISRSLRAVETAAA
jgi:NitT/TauT family transport system ATP-binding protein